MSTRQDSGQAGESDALRVIEMIRAEHARGTPPRPEQALRVIGFLLQQLDGFREDEAALASTLGEALALLERVVAMDGDVLHDAETFLAEMRREGFDDA
jgi:hypothetical protein